MKGWKQSSSSQKGHWPNGLTLQYQRRALLRSLCLWSSERKNLQFLYLKKRTCIFYNRESHLPYHWKPGHSDSIVVGVFPLYLLHVRAIEPEASLFFNKTATRLSEEMRDCSSCVDDYTLNTEALGFIVWLKRAGKASDRICYFYQRSNQKQSFYHLQSRLYFLLERRVVHCGFLCIQKWCLKCHLPTITLPKPVDPRDSRRSTMKFIIQQFFKRVCFFLS